MSDRAHHFYRLAAGLAWAMALLTVAAAWASLLNSIVLGRVGTVLRAQIIAYEPWKWSPAFILAAAAAILQLPVALAAADLMEGRPALERLGRSYGAVGAVLAAVTQFLQATVSRKAALGMILEHHERAKQPYLTLSTEWNLLFPFSTAYGLAMLAATFTAVLFLCLGLAFIRACGLRRVLAAVALIAAAAQFVGVIGYVSDYKPANFGADVCDLLVPVILILLGFAFRQEAKKERGELTTGTQPANAAIQRQSSLS